MSWSITRGYLVSRKEDVVEKKAIIELTYCCCIDREDGWVV